MQRASGQAWRRAENPRGAWVRDRLGGRFAFSKFFRRRISGISCRRDHRGFDHGPRSSPGPARHLANLAWSYKSTTKKLPEIARELNVEAVVEGSVVRAGDRVRVSAQ